MIPFTLLALGLPKNAARILKVHLYDDFSSVFTCTFLFLCSLTFYYDDAFFVDYMVEKLGIDKSKIDDLCNLLYKNYGTTMAGLRV